MKRRTQIFDLLLQILDEGFSPMRVGDRRFNTPHYHLRSNAGTAQLNIMRWPLHQKGAAAGTPEQGP